MKSKDTCADTRSFGLVLVNTDYNAVLISPYLISHRAMYNRWRGHWSNSKNTAGKRINEIGTQPVHITSITPSYVGNFITTVDDDSYISILGDEEHSQLIEAIHGKIDKLDDSFAEEYSLGKYFIDNNSYYAVLFSVNRIVNANAITERLIFSLIKNEDVGLDSGIYPVDNKQQLNEFILPGGYLLNIREGGTDGNRIYVDRATVYCWSDSAEYTNKVPIVLKISTQLIRSIIRGKTDVAKSNKTQPEQGKPLEQILSEDDKKTVAFINASVAVKPKRLIIPDNKWKFMVRTAIRAKNLLFTGPAGCGKTFAAYSVADSMQRPFFYFNLGATQDPRSTLIGNMHFTDGTGTDFIESEFIRAIKTPNAVILLDELSRAHPEAWNILMTALDVNQRYVRVDEARDSANNIVKVHDTVSFFATANIGMEYTSTRVLDRAITDRFQILEMDYLNKDEQIQLLDEVVPKLREHSPELLFSISDIYDTCMREARSGSGKISTAISTRVIIELAQTIMDGFSLADAAELCIYPYFPDDGGADSERTYVRQLVQKHIRTNQSDDPLFNK
ncbi:AAA domain containing protein [Microcystis phage Mel-JY01]